MRGVEKVLEDIDALRRRITRLESLGYVEANFMDRVQPKVIDLYNEVESYISEMGNGQHSPAGKVPA